MITSFTTSASSNFAPAGGELGLFQMRGILAEPALSLGVAGDGVDKGDGVAWRVDEFEDTRLRGKGVRRAGDAVTATGGSSLDGPGALSGWF